MRLSSISLACLAVVALTGCHHDVALSSTPSPAALASAEAKLDSIYSGVATKFQTGQSHVDSIARMAASGDASGTSSKAQRDRQQIEDTKDACDQALVDLSRGTTIQVAIPDHPKYIAYYTAIGGKLTARTNEYKAMLTLADAANADNAKAVATAATDVQKRDEIYDKLVKQTH